MLEHFDERLLKDILRFHLMSPVALAYDEHFAGEALEKCLLATCFSLYAARYEVPFRHNTCFIGYYLYVQRLFR